MKIFIYDTVRGQLLPLFLEKKNISGKGSQGRQERKQREKKLKTLKKMWERKPQKARDKRKREEIENIEEDVIKLRHYLAIEGVLDLY